MFVVLYLAHGISVRTSTALAGTLVGVGVTALLGLYAVDAARLSGLGDESGELLRAQAPDMNFQGLLTCAVIVAGLGVLNDVTITQSSAVWELRAAAPEMTRRQLFASGMRIGRDHIASTIYTIVFAYAGTSLVVLLLLSLYDRPLLDLLTDEAIAEEVLRTLASAIGLVLAVPATTAIATATVASARRPEPAPSASAPTERLTQPARMRRQGCLTIATSDPTHVGRPVVARPAPAADQDGVARRYACARGWSGNARRWPRDRGDERTPMPHSRPCGTRTHNQRIKSPELCQLS